MDRDDDLLPIPDFAAYCGGISVWTVAKWLSEDKLTRTKIGRRTFIRRSERERIAVEGGKSVSRTRIGEQEQ